MSARKITAEFLKSQSININQTSEIIIDILTLAFQIFVKQEMTVA